MLAKFVQCDDSIDYTPSADVACGAVVQLGSLFGIALSAIASGILGALAVDGIFDLAKDDTSGPVIAAGDPVFWDAANSVATNDAGDGLPYIGTAVADAATDDDTVRTRINDGNAVPAALRDLIWEDVAANKTLDAQDVGKVMLVTADAVVVTLPATAAGLKFVVANGGADAAVLVTISPNAADKIMGADLAGVDDKDRLNTKATARRLDFCELTADASAGYYVTHERGIWVAEA